MSSCARTDWRRFILPSAVRGVFLNGLLDADMQQCYSAVIALFPFLACSGPHPEPMTCFPFHGAMPRHSRFLLAAVAAAAIAGGISLYVPIFRRQAAIGAIERHGGCVQFRHHESPWGFGWIQRLLPRLLDDLYCIELTDTRQTDAILAGLPNLPEVCRLQLWGSDVTDDGLRDTASLPNLKELGLQYTSISGTGLAAAGRLAHLQKLDLFSAAVTDTGLSQLAGFQQLTELDLSYTRITDISLETASTLRNLTTLGLCHTQITDAGLKHLGKLGSLRILDLSGTALTDDGAQILAALPAITTLDLSHTRITDNGLRVLQRCTQLEHLHLSGCRVTNDGLARFRAAVPDAYVVR